MYKKIVGWYLSHDAMPYWCLFFADCAIVYLSGIATYAVNHGLAVCVGDFGPLLKTMIVYLLCYIMGFRLFHTYAGILRHSTFTDLVRTSLALLLGIIVIMLLRIFLHVDDYLLTIRFRDLLLHFLLATFGMWSIRIGVKVIYDHYIKNYMFGGAYGWNDTALLDMEMRNLLPREPILINKDNIRREMEGKSILVTGAAGSIGRKLASVCAECKPKQLVLIDQAETPLHDVRLEMRKCWPDVECHTVVTSICHSHRMDHIFSKYKPEIIFHAAAYKHVPMMEDNPVESILNNVDGTKKLADLAVKYDVKKFVMVSTDKAVNPTSVMGCSKRICEIYCQSLSKARREGNACEFITTRFGNVLGSSGSVIPIFREQIRNGGPLTVKHPDVTRYFMLTSEACLLVLEAAALGQGGNIYVFDMGHPVRIADLAKRMIELSGRTNIEIEYTGLRQGEKLNEEVLDETESVLPASHGKIKIAKVREYDFHTVSQQIDKLIETACTYDAAATIHLMEQIVPEYKSSWNKLS